jgi:endonuclease/exonuclease/phosphatase family metal-dependent hydrolase
MAGFFRKFTKQLIIGSNLLVSVAMLLLYLLPVADPNRFWFLNLLALAFPLLVVVQFGFLVFWLFAKRKLAWIPLLSLVLCYPLLRSTIGTSFSSKQESAAGFTTVTWNVHLLDFYEHNGHHSSGMLQSIKALEADVLAVQELVFSLDSNSEMSLDNLKQKLGYAYAVAGNDRKFGVHTNGGTKNERYFPFCVGIFSKYPILQWQKVQTLREYNHTFIWADIKVATDTIRFFNIHLQSMHFARRDYDFIENIDNQGMQQVKSTGKSIIRKMKQANVLRALQIKSVEEEIAKSPYPVILCGDFNDVPNSYAYQTMQSKLNDTHAEKGFGIGRTFLKLSPTLRIDYIFCSKSLKPLSNTTVSGGESDHKAVKVSFALPVNE